mgnify:CR=1 FL=1
MKSKKLKFKIILSEGQVKNLMSRSLEVHTRSPGHQGPGRDD